MHITRIVLAICFFGPVAGCVEPKCKVNDLDTSGFYKGDCVNGLAHGHGEARGRDVYVGTYSEGDEHGTGVYKWGPTSDWAGDVYTGDWKNGNRSGMGLYSSPRYEYEGSFLNGKYHGFGEQRVPKLETIGQNFHEDAFWRGDVLVFRGLWRMGDFLVACDSEDDCYARIELQKQKEAEQAARTEANRKRSATQERERSQRKESDQYSAKLRQELDDSERQKELDRQAYRQCQAQKETCYATCAGSSSQQACRLSCNKIRC